MAGPAGDEALARASLALEAIHSPRLEDQRRHLYGRRRWPGRRRYEYVWPFACAWSAVGTLGSVTTDPAVASHLAGFPTGLGAYLREPAAGESRARADTPLGAESAVVPPLGPGGERYYDDNAWLGLAALHHHGLTGDPALVALARRLLRFVLSGWSEDREWVHPGGIRWKEPATNRSRNTCANAPAAELAVRLYEETGDPSTLEWAERIYSWVRRALVASDGLYCDRITPEGRREPTVWTYNQGTMIGAGVLLHRATGRHEYLEEATATAAAAMDRFDPATLFSQGPAFNAVYFRNLLLLDLVASDAARLGAARDYGDALWARRDPRTGWFRVPGTPLHATAPMIEIYALCGGATAHP